MRIKRILLLLVILSIAGIVTYLYVYEPEYAYLPSDSKIKNIENKHSKQIYKETNVQDVDNEKFIQMGKQFFYKETFGNEVFFSDILGLFNGAFTIPNIAKAIVALKGEGTDNLKVKAAKSVKVGRKTINEGELIETGLDVAKGSFSPLGIKYKFENGRMKAGVSCAACHASVDKEGKVVQGVPNSNLNIGLTLALGTNTASYFTHTQLENLKEYIKDTSRVVETSNGKSDALPDIKSLEEYVDSEIIKWPGGSNDTTIDFQNNPVQGEGTEKPLVF